MANITGREIRFAVHVPAKEGYRDDVHYIKEVIHYDDGTSKPNTYLVKDYKIPTWITKQAYRNHEEKKEYEEIGKLTRIESTQSDRARQVAKFLGTPHLLNNPKALKDSPYLYGYDVTAASHILYKSITKNNGIKSRHTYCVLDIEAVPNTNNILLITISMKGKSYTTVLSSFLPNLNGYKERLHKLIREYLPAYADKHVFEFDTFLSKEQLVIAIFKKLHEWKPDFVAAWNMDYDVSQMLSVLEEANINPVHVLADQSIPLEYRYCWYKKGITKKVTASGKVQPINPALQWHSLILTAPFYFIDAMCVYRQLRMTKQEKTKLDSVLKAELKKSKLKFEPAKNYHGINEHYFMQAHYPEEYTVYNIWDTLSMLELEDKTGDITSKLPAFSGTSEFFKFNSNPKKIVDAFFLYALEQGYVTGTVGNVSERSIAPEDEDELLLVEDDDGNVIESEDPDDYDTLGLKGWIQTLIQHLLVQDGLKCLKEYPNLVTNVRGLTFDSDVTGAYPNATDAGNVSKATTLAEVIDIEGVPDYKFKELNLSIPTGDANTLDYFSEMFELPTLDSFY